MSEAESSVEIDRDRITQYDDKQKHRNIHIGGEQFILNKGDRVVFRRPYEWDFGVVEAVDADEVFIRDELGYGQGKYKDEVVPFDLVANRYKKELKQEIGKINIYHKKKLSGDSIMKKPSEIIKEVLKLLE